MNLSSKEVGWINSDAQLQFQQRDGQSEQLVQNFREEQVQLLHYCSELTYGLIVNPNYRKH